MQKTNEMKFQIEQSQEDYPVIFDENRCKISLLGPFKEENFYFVSRD